MAMPLPTPLSQDWDPYLDRLQRNVVDAEAALAAGKPMGWPEPLLPTAAPTLVQRERATELIGRMAAVLSAAEQHQETLRQELSGVRPAPPRPTGEQVSMGRRLDVRG
jgi:hypothetical protein